VDAAEAAAAAGAGGAARSWRALAAKGAHASEEEVAAAPGAELCSLAELEAREEQLRRCEEDAVLREFGSLLEPAAAGLASPQQPPRARRSGRGSDADQRVSDAPSRADSGASGFLAAAAATTQRRRRRGEEGEGEEEEEEEATRRGAKRVAAEETRGGGVEAANKAALMAEVRRYLARQIGPAHARFGEFARALFRILVEFARQQLRLGERRLAAAEVEALAMRELPPLLIRFVSVDELLAFRAADAPASAASAASPAPAPALLATFAAAPDAAAHTPRSWASTPRLDVSAAAARVLAARATAAAAAAESGLAGAGEHAPPPPPPAPPRRRKATQGALSQRPPQPQQPLAARARSDDSFRSFLRSG
jgi:hypothetical protein